MLLQIFTPAFIWLNIFQKGQKWRSMVAFILHVVEHGTIINVFGWLLVSTLLKIIKMAIWRCMDIPCQSIPGRIFVFWMTICYRTNGHSPPIDADIFPRWMYSDGYLFSIRCPSDTKQIPIWSSGILHYFRQLYMHIMQ